MMSQLERSKRWATRATAVVAGAELGFIVGDVNGAIQGGVYAGRAFDQVYPDPDLEPEPVQDIVLPSKSMKVGNVFQGVVHPLGKEDKYLESDCLSHGWHVTKETFGTVADPDAVYIQHSTYTLTGYIEAILGAMIREVVRLGGQQLGDTLEEIAGSGVETSTSVVFQYTYINVQTAVQTQTANYVLDANDSISSVVAGWTQVRAHLENYLQNGGGSGLEEPFKLSMSHTNNNSEDLRIIAVLNLQNCHMMLYSTSELKFQNRTKAANAAEGNNEIDRIDSAPIVLRTYNFKHADMRLKVPTANNAYILNGVPQESIRLVRAAEFSTNISFQNRPHPNIFSNCVGAFDQVVNPGVMKNSAISYKFSGKFMNNIKLLKQISVTGEIAQGVFGRSQLFMFEELMRTSTTNWVEVSYERQSKIGCIFKRLSPAPIVSQFQVNAVVNNTPPPPP